MRPDSEDQILEGAGATITDYISRHNRKRGREGRRSTCRHSHFPLDLSRISPCLQPAVRTCVDSPIVGKVPRFHPHNDLTGALGCARRRQLLPSGGADSSRGRGSPGRYRSFPPSLYSQASPHQCPGNRAAGSGFKIIVLGSWIRKSSSLPVYTRPCLSAPAVCHGCYRVQLRCCLLEFLRRAPTVGSLPLPLPLPLPPGRAPLPRKAS